jgi:hypothetical protein
MGPGTLDVVSSIRGPMARLVFVQAVAEAVAEFRATTVVPSGPTMR